MSYPPVAPVLVRTWHDLTTGETWTSGTVPDEPQPGSPPPPGPTGPARRRPPKPKAGPVNPPPAAPPTLGRPPTHPQDDQEAGEVDPQALPPPLEPDRSESPPPEPDTPPPTADRPAVAFRPPGARLTDPDRRAWILEGHGLILLSLAVGLASFCAGGLLALPHGQDQGAIAATATRVARLLADAPTTHPTPHHTPPAPTAPPPTLAPPGPTLPAISFRPGVPSATEIAAIPPTTVPLPATGHPQRPGPGRSTQPRSSVPVTNPKP